MAVKVEVVNTMNPTFTVIMACYHVENYIAEAIESLINQTIGFEKHIELILVNDDSPDGLEPIALRYQSQYPNNIVYIKQQNQGPGGARNTGLNYEPRGKYVSFMDPDDVLDTHCLESVLRGFQNAERNNYQVDMAMIPMRFFGAQQGNHLLNYKFAQGTRVIDVSVEYENPTLSVASSFFRSSAIGNLRFNTTLRNSEDTLFIAQFLRKTMKILAVADTTYWYRRRPQDVAPSLTQLERNQRRTFEAIVDQVCKPLVSWYVEQGKPVHPYIQYLCLYDMWWRLSLKGGANLFSENDVLEYVRKVRYVLEYIDPEVIATFDRRYSKEVSYFSLLRRTHQLLLLRYTKVVGKYVVLEGDIYGDIKHVVFQNRRGLQQPVTILPVDPSQECSLFEQAIQKHSFSIQLPLNELLQHGEFIITPTAGVPQVLYNTGKHSKFIPSTHGFYAKLNKKFVCFQHGLFTEGSRGIVATWKREYRIAKYMKCTFSSYMSKNRAMRMILLGLAGRCVCGLLRPLQFQKKWLFTDRQSIADDNGEALFKYVIAQKKGNNKHLKHVKPIFVVNKKSLDYKRLKRLGKVVPFGSKLHTLYFLLAEYHFHSHFDHFIIEPLKRGELYFRDMPKPRSIFLQHGITKDDMSELLKREIKNFNMFVTATKKEYQSVLEYPYGYNQNQVKLTGFARYDLLSQSHVPEKIIVVVPTWRKHLSNLTEDAFVESDYFLWWNRLLQDKTFHKNLRNNGYRVLFLPHPAMYRWIEYFSYTTGLIEPVIGNFTYRDLFHKAAVVVTDYSSAVFDAAYTGRPIVYYQFDAEAQFSGGHIYRKGYFDYNRDGLGPVCQNTADVVHELAVLMEQSFPPSQPEPYGTRVNEFFAFHDTNNCQRILDEALTLRKDT